MTSLRFADDASSDSSRRLRTRAHCARRRRPRASNHGDSRGGYGELAEARVRSFRNPLPTHPIELHFFSDTLQKSADALRVFRKWCCPQNASLVLHQVGERSGAELGRGKRRALRHMVWDPKKAHLQAVIVGFGTPGRQTRTVSLVVDGKTAATKTVDVPANGRATAEFQSLEVPYGFTRCEVRI